MRKFNQLVIVVIIIICIGVAFLVGMEMRTPVEVQYDEMGWPTPVCICECGDIYVDCCCDTPTATGTPQVATKPTASATLPSNGDASKTPTPIVPTPTKRSTRKPTATPTEFPSIVPKCYQWLCHKPGTAAEQNYCCDSDGCVSAHLRHGDYLGRCT